MHAQKIVVNNLCVAHGIRMLRKTKIQAAVSCTFGKIGLGSAQIGREIYYGGALVLVTRLRRIRSTDNTRDDHEACTMFSGRKRKLREQSEWHLDHVITDAINHYKEGGDKELIAIF